ncbi:hypothetical protein SCLCIDRAFT_1223204 [Scleroderma citrinum Foug A]|uniref:Uncharacterized protein n=1 Tax=Scleroderma citrinum Foug A TaxID=1036808 RepID=A0A0C3DAJ7_9AGAM|nr:hypothetical protein SCLCIDRAFT_1223204 [Scleroderma citrinum Foug A]
MWEFSDDGPLGSALEWTCYLHLLHWLGTGVIPQDHRIQKEAIDQISVTPTTW